MDFVKKTSKTLIKQATNQNSSTIGGKTIA